MEIENKNINIPKKRNINSENCQKKELLINYIKNKCFYNNLFIYIKVMHQRFEKLQIDDQHYIHQHLLNLFNMSKDKDSTITFKHISGAYGKLPKEMIFIPKNFIVNFFRVTPTGCCDENDFIKDKIDLYISVLTYIYTSFKVSVDEMFHENVISCIKESDEQTIDSLYDSIIYDFSNIPNIVEEFIYKFSDLKTNAVKFYHHYSQTSSANKKNVSYFYNFMTHHLVTIFRFYKQYIISYYITDFNNLYKEHPLENVCHSIKSLVSN